MLMTNMGHVMTLANSIIGVGILAMPFCFHKCGIILSILLLVLNYLVTRVSCYYLIKSALLVRRRSFEFLGFYAFGSSGKLMVELCIIGYLIGTCIAYFVVVGDLGPRIIAKILDLDENDNLRTWVMVIVTILCIIPLGLLRNVDSLSAVSAASIGFYICLVLKVISESQLHLIANDWYDKVVYWQPEGILQCLPIFSMACSCQMQLFEVMETVPNQSLDKMNAIVKKATKICTSVYVMVGLFGYIGFCTIPFTGNILIHFSPTISSEIIKMGFVLSVAFSFPLVIFPCRVSIYSLIYKRGHGDASTYIPEKRFKAITISIVLISLLVALMIPSIELVIGLVGSTIGVAICVMFPASVYLKMFTKIRPTEKTVAQVVLVGGFILMILGTYANLNAIDEKRSGISTETNELSRLNQNDIRLPESLVDKLAQKELEKNLIPSVPASVLSTNSKIMQPKLPFEDLTKVEKEKSKLPIENLKIASTEKTVDIEKSKLPVETVEEPKKLSNEISKTQKETVIESLASQMQSENSNAIKKEPAAPILNNPIPNEIEKSKQPNNVKESLDLKLNENDKISSLDSKLSNLTSNVNIIDKEAIKKDEEIAAEEESKDKDTKLEKAEAELKKTKEMLEKKVDELKQEIVKQNEETQKLVNEKLSNIIEQVKEIKEEVQEEKKIEQLKINENNEKTKVQANANEVLKPNLPEVDTDIKFSASKGSLVAQLNKKIEEAQKLSKSDNLTEIKRNDLTVPGSRNMPQKEIKESKEQTKQESPKSNIEPLKEKVYEPLSYKTGEMLNKINETQMKGKDKRGPIPLPLLLNSTNSNKLIPSNIIITNIQSHDLNNTVKIQTPLENNTINKELNISGYIPPITNKITESNIEAIRRDILEIKEKTLTGSDEKLNREKRDLKNFEYNLSIQNNNENCLPNCIKTEPSLQNMNLVIEELNNGLKMMTGGRDLKSVNEKNNEKN